MKVIPDTHALIWYLEANPRLGDRGSFILGDLSSEIIVPVIVLGEILYYLRKKGLSERYPVFFQKIKGDERIAFRDVTAEIVSLIPEGLEMHDGLIAATWLMEKDVKILSCDKHLKKWNSSAIVWD